MIRLYNAIVFRTKKLIFWILYGRKMQSFGSGSVVIDYLKIQNPQFIKIGSNVYIHKYTWLTAVRTQNENPLLEFGDGCTIGNFNHIICAVGIKFGKKVLTADKVYISDNLHGYSDINMAIMDQPLVLKKPVHIGDGAWIGENVCIIGASIGRNSVVGANSVVTKDVPDYTVVAGNPAVVIKQFNHQTDSWERVNTKVLGSN